MTFSEEVYHLLLGCIGGAFTCFALLAVDDWRKHRKVRKQLRRIDEARTRRYLLDYDEEEE